MLNILILAAGGARGQDLPAPICLTEIDEKPLLQTITENCQLIPDAHLIYAIKDQDIKRFSLDKVCKILDPRSNTIQVKGSTQGAACTALLAIDLINNSEELLILATNEQIEVNFVSVIASFREQNIDAGTIVFPAIHPRYSYVRINDVGLVDEVAEKRPISRFATASFYWFKQGSDFVKSAQAMLLKQSEVSGYYFISPTFNELILQGKKIGVFEIDSHRYRPLKKDSL